VFVAHDVAAVASIGEGDLGGQCFGGGDEDVDVGLEVAQAFERSRLGDLEPVRAAASFGFVEQSVSQLGS